MLSGSYMTLQDFIKCNIFLHFSYIACFLFLIILRLDYSRKSILCIFIILSDHDMHFAQMMNRNFFENRFYYITDKYRNIQKDFNC